VASFIFLDKYIFPFIMVPMTRMLPEGGKLITTEASEFFMLWIKVGFFAGLLIAMPFILYQLWLFVAPGLYSHEKRFAIPFVLFASIFFFGGAMFSHYIAFPVTWGFFITFNPSFVQFMPKIGPAFALYVKMALACGAVFQMPVLVFALARMGMVTAGFLLRNFKYAVLIIAILGAVLSPGGDIASQMILSGPMLVLYIISIGVAWAFQKRKPAAEAAS
jgi:sec-independent protein translocase protein TatC